MHSTAEKELLIVWSGQLRQVDKGFQLPPHYHRDIPNVYNKIQISWLSMESSQGHSSETSLALFQSRGANYAHNIGLNPPRFLTSRRSCYVMYDGRLLKLYNMSDDFEFLSVSNRIHQQKKEMKNLSISALIALEIPPSFILMLAWYAAIGQQIHEKLQPASYSTEKFFYSCIINDLCQKIHESNTFSSDFFFNFHPIYKFKSWNGYYFHFFEMFIFSSSKLSVLGTVWNWDTQFLCPV